MLLHKITYQAKQTRISGVTLITKWAGSGKDAGSIRKEARRSMGYVANSIQTSKVNVPTDKKGLLEFLNE